MQKSQPQNNRQSPAESAVQDRYGWLFKPVTWIIIALTIRLLYLLEQGGSSPLFYVPLLDEKEAVTTARNILNGLTDNEPYFKAPGYSWILAAVMKISGGAWPWTIRLLQHVCGALLVGMTAWLAGRLSPAGSPRRWAVAIAGLLAATYAPIIRLEDNLSLDFWSVFLQSAMLYWLVKSATVNAGKLKYLAFAGLMAAAAWLVRPTITVVFPLIAVWMLWPIGQFLKQPKPVLRNLLIFAIPIIIAMFGVTLRNKLVGGETLTMPWQGGYSLYYANKPGATGKYYLQSGVVEDDHANPTRSLAVNGYLQSLSPAEQQAFSVHPVYKNIDKFWFNKTTTAVKSGPSAWLALMGKKVVYLLSDKEIYNYEDFDLQKSLSGILPWLPGRFGVVFPLALASLVVWFGASRIRRRIYLLLWFYIAALGGGIALYYVSGRMRMPLAFPLMAMAGSGVAALPALSTKRKIAAAILICLGLVISWGNWWGVRSESFANVDLVRMSNAAWNRGRYEQALDLALQSEKIEPGYPVLPRTKGQALYNLGRLDEARAEFQKSVDILNDETSKHNLEIIRTEIEKRSLNQTVR